MGDKVVGFVIKSLCWILEYFLQQRDLERRL